MLQRPERTIMDLIYNCRQFREVDWKNLLWPKGVEGVDPLIPRAVCAHVNDGSR